MSDEAFKRGVALMTSPEAKSIKVDTKTKLMLYGLYKQATVGPNTTPQPRRTDLMGTYKWKAWKACGDMSKDEAQRKYLEALRKIAPPSMKSKL
jgi:acyl-CoA-binding protein